MATSGRGWYWHLAGASLLGMGGAIGDLGNCAKAQITPDTTLGAESSVVTPNTGDVDVISGGATWGGNLFHSFEQFSVPTGSAAHFNNALDIQNIISRVTGESISNIDGLIRANGTANLFLLNPNGIIFGPNASLNIGGSFLGSTASTLNFADGTQFSATAPTTTPLLTVSVPFGLQFGGTAGDIQVQQSILQVQTGQTLGLMGGDVSVEGGEFGFLEALGGRIELGGLAGVGMVNIEGQQSKGAFRLTSLRFPDAVERADVLLTNFAFVQVAAGGSGSIAINARNLDVLGGSSLLAGIEGGLGSVGTQAGDITLNATDAITVGQSSGIQNSIGPDATGAGGSINITTGLLSVTNGAFVNASTYGRGNAGSVNINARNTVFFDRDSAVFTNVTTSAEGNGSDINITTGSLFVTNGAFLSALTRGQGDAGSVNINARDTVSFNGGSGAFSTVGSRAVGNGGGINITTGSLSVTNGAQLQASTSGQGNAGSVTIQAIDSVSFDGVGSNGFNSGASTRVEARSVGNGGGINITAGSLSLTNGAELAASTGGQGNGGSVTIQVSGPVFMDGVGSNGFSSGAFNNVRLGGVGKGGNIDVTAGSLSASNGAQLSTAIFGRGDAGSVTINARDTISFDGVGSNGLRSGAFSTIDFEGVGKGGDINVTTGSLSATNGAGLAANTFGQGNAGSVTITARDTISLDGVGGVESAVAPKAVGEGGNITVTAGALFGKNGAHLAVSTLGQGNAGSVTINVRDTVSFDGVSSDGFSSGAFSTVEAGAMGNGKDINITTGFLSVKNGALLAASTRGKGDGGNITLNANTLEAVNGGQVLTTSRSSGKAGNIRVNATDTVTLSGSDRTYFARLAQFGEGRVSDAGSASGLFASTFEEATGQGANLRITTGQLIVQDGAEVNVSSEGSGNAGNLEVVANSISLDNRATLSANTRAGQGNINLDSQDLVLRRSSNITTDAQGTAEGGNITIDTGVIAALEDSDISANAQNARGGRVIIDAQGIFGTEFRNQDTSRSDITATSELGPEFSGTVEINTPDVDLSSGLATLPAELVDVTGLIAQDCPGSRGNVGKGVSEFIITGRGGLPPSPSEALRSDAVRVDLDTPIPSEENHASATVSTNLTISEPVPIVEAQGWVINNKGEVVLTATAPTAIPHIPWLTPATCHALQNSP